MAGLNQLVGIVLVERPALRLIIRPKRPADSRPLVEIYAQPVKAIDQELDGTLKRARRIGIFDTQDE